VLTYLKIRQVGFDHLVLAGISDLAGVLINEAEVIAVSGMLAKGRADSARRAGK
jgi:hypothetical protein